MEKTGKREETFPRLCFLPIFVRGGIEMSSDDYSSSRTYSEKSYASARSEDERARLLAERRDRVEAARGEVTEKSARPRPKRNVRDLYQEGAVHKLITRPAPGVKRVYIVLIDNSGSNQTIANHFRNSTNYLRVNLGVIDPEAQYVFVYFSDHRDRQLWWQPVDYISPTEEGEVILTSTLFHVEDANGQDAPEAHECALRDICRIDFGDATERHLILVSDVVGHGMGMHDDEGCPNQQSWQESLDLVEKTFTSFEVIGCGDESWVADLQQKFISYKHPELLAQNFVSLAHIKEHQYRLGIVLNAFLLLVARHQGMQGIEGFLSRLYEKWLEDPIFGGDTDRRAKEAILRFGKYLPGQGDIVKMMSRVLSIPTGEVERLIEQDKVFI
jgi:hypothetical protein